MPTLLRIDVSPRLEGSQSKVIADHFVAAWKEKNPNGSVIHSDLAKEPVPHVDELATAAFLTGHADRTPELDAAVSDRMAAEFQSADEVLISSPMYNFGAPSGLKAYIGHIVRAAMTFSYDPAAGVGSLANQQRVYLAVSYGAAGFIDGPMSWMDFLKPYLETIVELIGVPKVDTLYIEGAAIDPEAPELARAALLARISGVLAS